jgi:heme A synthase
LLAAAFLAVLETSPRWTDFAPFSDGGWPSLRQLAWVTPAVTLIQIALGAAYRHRAMGLIPHVSWAFATAICVMMAATFVLSLEGGGALLRRISIWLLALTGLQILLGVAAYLARIDLGASWASVAPTAHVATGSLVMALSCVWSAVVWRDARPAAQADPFTSGQHS